MNSTLSPAPLFPLPLITVVGAPRIPQEGTRAPCSCYLLQVFMAAEANFSGVDLDDHPQLVFFCLNDVLATFLLVWLKVKAIAGVIIRRYVSGWS